MAKRYSESFKIQAVEKVLNRSPETTIEEILSTLGVSRSAMSRWLLQARDQKLGLDNSQTMTKEVRPQDLSLKDRLNHIKSCSSLDMQEISSYCREHGLYPHHIKQWEEDFITGKSVKSSSNKSEIRSQKVEIKQLKNEINRKDKALAETAALLVLQKKSPRDLGKTEDNSQ